MENQTEFSVKPAIEQTPFQETPTQQFFSKWCEVNDSIEPKYLPREEWEKRKKDGLLQKQEKGKKQDLLIPEDLKLWEMVDVIASVDKDTFAHNPGKMQNKRKELGELGDMFVNAGIYLAQRREGIKEGKHTAEETAKDLYRYGNALRTGDYGEQTPIADIADNALSTKQTEEIDKWFGVDKLAKLKQQEPEQTRQEMLAQFFKVTEKANDSESHRKALEKVHKRVLEKPINRPDQELQSAIFRRGTEKILSEMGKEGWRGKIVENFKELGIDLEKQQENIREILEIPRLKIELALVKETGDKEKIGDKEREIAAKIQEAVSKIPYAKKDGEPDYEGSNPSWIAEHQSLICVGATVVGGALLRDAGINYLVGSMPNHSFTFLVTSDDRVYDQDFLSPPDGNSELKNDKIRSDLVSYSRSSNDDGFVFGEFSATHPDKGEQVQILDNYGIGLADSGQTELAIEFFKRSIALDKNNVIGYRYLGLEYKKLNNYEEARKMFEKTIELNPEDKKNYARLGFVMEDLGRPQDALSAFRHIVSLDPKDSSAQHEVGTLLKDLGRKEEAIDALRAVTILEPEDLSVQIELGETLAEVGQKDEAIAVFNKIVELSSKDKKKVLMGKMAELHIAQLTK